VYYWFPPSSGVAALRLLEQTGTGWTARDLAMGASAGLPAAIGVDAAGNTHVVWTEGGLDYAICAIPRCPQYPGMTWWSDESGNPTITRLTWYGDEAPTGIALGLDGSLHAVFKNTGWRLGAIRLHRPGASVTPPRPRLPSAGTVLPATTIPLSISWSGSGATDYRLELQDGLGWLPVAPPSAATTTTFAVGPSRTFKNRYRVVPLAGGDVDGPTAHGLPFRVFVGGDAPNNGMTYSGSWTKASIASAFGGTVRWSKSKSARATFTFTGSEISWISATGATRGSARVLIDGVKVATVKLEGTKSSRRVVFRRTLAPGTHTIVIRPSGNGRVDIDGFVVLD
jgi:hypothetical protein